MITTTLTTANTHQRHRIRCAAHIDKRVSIEFTLWPQHTVCTSKDSHNVLFFQLRPFKSSTPPLENSPTGVQRKRRFSLVSHLRNLVLIKFRLNNHLSNPTANQLSIYLYTNTVDPFSLYRLNSVHTHLFLHWI